MTILYYNMGGDGYELCMGEMQNAYRILAEKLEGKSPLETPRHRW
jgi:hypothetical protein